MGVPVSDDALSVLVKYGERQPQEDAWLCTSQRCVAVPQRLAALASSAVAWANQVTRGRMTQERWLRYSMLIDEEFARSALQRLASCKLRVEAMTEQAIGDIAALYPHANQVTSAKSLWAAGLRRAFLARDAENRPLAFAWTMQHDDHQRLRRLGEWAGMYPPLAEGWVQVENVFSASRSLARGQLMTDLVYAAVAATDVTAIGIVAHVGHGNHVVRRWMESLGCRGYGMIVRSRVDLPVLRRHHLFIHTLDPAVA